MAPVSNFSFNRLTTWNQRDTTFIIRQNQSFLIEAFEVFQLLGETFNSVSGKNLVIEIMFSDKIVNGSVNDKQ